MNNQLAEMRERLETASKQLDAAEQENEALADQVADLIEVYARGEVSVAAFGEKLDALEDAQRQNERRRQTLATTRDRVAALLAEAEEAARLDQARRELAAVRQRSAPTILRFLRSKALFLIAYYEVRSLQAELKKLTHTLHGDVDDVPGPIVAWAKVNPYLVLPKADQITHWDRLARELDDINLAIDMLGGEPVYGGDDLGDIEIAFEAAEEEEV